MLASVLVVLVLAAVYQLIAAPIIGLYDQRAASLADRRVLAPRLSAIAQQLPALRTQVAQLRAAAKTSRIALDGGSDAVASANMQSRIEELAKSSGATIGSTEALTAENRDAYRRIGLRFSVSSEYANLVRLLAAIESGTPPLVLGGLQIRSTAPPIGDASSARLDASFEVYGFRSIDTSRGAKP